MTTVAPNPIADTLGINQSLVEQRRLLLEVEEAVAQCMHDEGFEYYPEQVITLPGAEDEDLRYTDPLEYGRRYGYGVVYEYEITELPGLVADPGEAVDETFGDADSVSPNTEYVLSLTSSEADVYARVLEGPVVVDESGFPIPSAPTGCRGTAQADVYGDDPLERPDVQAILADAAETSQYDARIIDASEAWSKCLAKKIPDPVFLSPGSPYMYVMTRKQDLLGFEPTDFEGNPIDPMKVEVGQGFSWRLRDETGPPRPIPDEPLEALRTFELKLWAQDQECQKQTRYQDTIRAFESEVAAELGLILGD